MIENKEHQAVTIGIMKKINLLILFISVVFISCKKENNEPVNPADDLIPAQLQWGLAINYTATWCYYCGEWGAPLIHEFADTGYVVAISVHAQNDPMFNGMLYNSLTSERPTGGGIPSFWVGDVQTTDMSAMTSLLNEIPVAALAIHSDRSADSLKVEVKTVFYEADSSEFFLSVLILEDGIDGSANAGNYAQNGTANPDNYKHDFVLRASSVPSNGYGESLITAPTAGTEVSSVYSIYISPEWDDVYAVAILWRVDLWSSPAFKYVNAVK